MNRVIASFDTDRIKEYVFSTGILKEIRGASTLLDELNRKEMQEKIKEIDPTAECIFANVRNLVVSLYNCFNCITCLFHVYQKCSSYPK
ncbi:MAG TPA: hypothetical protein VJL89_06310 [Thermodesulfovibrionia bacterium]|nr:hypothetical protein [Thermodesulfovibrionia bacterium]